MSKDSGYRYYEASSTVPGPGGRCRSVLMSNSSAVDIPVSLNGGVVKVAAGAGNKCVAPVRSRPKRRQTIRHADDTDTDSLDLPSVEWTTPSLSVSQLSTSYQTQCPLLARVNEGCADFTRGQVHTD